MRLRPLLAVAFTVLAACGSAQTPTDQPATFVSSYDWHVDDPQFGGWSGLDMWPDGLEFAALSDRNYVMRGRFIREDGIITGLEAGPIRELRGPGDVDSNPAHKDSEGIAIAPDGSFYVSFELWTRVSRYNNFEERIEERLPSHPDFRNMPKNTALESVAIDADGTLYAIQEEMWNEGDPFKVYRFRDGAWDTELTIPSQRPFRAVGSDIGPDGRFYLLERALTSIMGFSTRVRRFDMGPDGFTNETLLLQTEPGTHDNLEGLTTWRDDDGMIRLTMVSDNNFKFFQRNEVVEYTVPE